MDLTERLRAWSYRRQQLGGDTSDPLDALRSIVAVYSSHPTAPLSLLARCRDLDEARFQRLERERNAVRVPAMRTSVFLVPVEDAPAILAATPAPARQMDARLRYGGFDRGSYEMLKPLVLDAAREPVSAADLQKAVPVDGQLMVAVRVMATEGLVLRVGTSLRSDRLQYVATDAWLDAPFEQREPDASLAWLAGAYLRAFGPARLDDFAWWSGATKGRARTALAAHVTVDIGDGLLLLEELHDAFDAVEPVDPDAIDLLPKWDAWAMGYAPDGRGRLVDDAHLLRAYSSAKTQYGATAGDGLPLLLRGGEAVASWSHTFQRDRRRIEITPFASELAVTPEIEAAFADVGWLLGASNIEVRIGSA